MRPLWKSWLVTIFLLVIYDFSLPAACPASNPAQGARAAAMGGAMAAIADDPSTIAFNPAGLTNMKGAHIYGGMTALTIHTDFEDPQGRSETTRSQVFLSPHLYMSSDFGSKTMAFGIGVFSPFGIGGRRWDDSGLTRYVSTDSLIATVNVNPAFAFRPLPGLSLGAGLNYLYALSRSKRKIDQSALNAPDGSFEYDGDGDGWGYNFGLLYAVSDKVSLGAAYRSRTSVRQKGTVTIENIAAPLQTLFGGDRYRTGAGTTLRFPAAVSGGASFRPTRKWTVGLDVEWIDWSRFSRSRLDIEKEVPAAGLTDASFDAGWGSSWFFKLGLEHRWNERLFLRGGYVYATSPVPDRTLSADNPDADQHNLALGLGGRFGKFTIDGFYNLTLFKDRQVDNPILSGRYENTIHTAGFSIGYRF
jgi:long-chain fatty acid transport protein